MKKYIKIKSINIKSINKKSIRNLGLSLLLTVCLLCLCMVIPASKDGENTAQATTVQEVRSMDDFKTKLADQIYRREVLEYYTVKDKSLGKQIVHTDLSGFQAHVNPSEPLKSGCYLCYYLKTVYYEYSGTQLKVMVVFPYDKTEMDSHFERMDRLAEELKGETDYDTVKNVHDYLVKNFEYDYSTSMVNHTDIDGFRDGRMVCSGYGLATYYLLNKVGIKTEIVTGGSGTPPSNTSDHMWNMVCLDGKWYNLDVTWDDAGGENVKYTYFLKSDADFPGHKRLGEYDTSYYNGLVSKESYPMPTEFNKNWLILGGAALLLLIVFIWSRKKRADDPSRYRGYVVGEDGDPLGGGDGDGFGRDMYGNDGRYAGTNDLHRQTWDADERQRRQDVGRGSPWDVTRTNDEPGDNDFM